MVNKALRSSSHLARANSQEGREFTLAPLHFNWHADTPSRAFRRRCKLQIQKTAASSTCFAAVRACVITNKTGFQPLENLLEGAERQEMWRVHLIVAIAATQWECVCVCVWNPDSLTASSFSQLLGVSAEDGVFLW